MSTYLGSLAGMTAVPCLGRLEVVPSVSDEVRTDIKGQPYLVRRGSGEEWRAWTCQMGAQEARDLAVLRELTLWSRGPYWMVACDASETNILPPMASVTLAGWSGGPIERGGPIVASWVRGTQWTQVSPGVWSTTAPSVTASGDVANVPSEDVASLGDGRYMLLGQTVTTSPLPWHVTLDSAAAYTSPRVPVIPDLPVTAGTYVNGGSIRLRWWTPTGTYLSGSSAVTDAPGQPGTQLRRLTITRTPPAGASAVDLVIEGATRAARPSISWTPAAHEWVEGRGASAVVVDPVPTDLIHAARGTTLVQSEYNVREVIG